MYLEIRLFNWTNPDQVHNHSVKPHFIEMGPYVFLEKHTRVNLTWNLNNGTVAYNQSRTWHYVPELSNGSLTDEVTNINTMAAVSPVFIYLAVKIMKFENLFYC